MVGWMVVVAVYKNGRISDNAKNKLSEEYTVPPLLVAFQLPPLGCGVSLALSINVALAAEILNVKDQNFIHRKLDTSGA